MNKKVQSDVTVIFVTTGHHRSPLFTTALVEVTLFLPLSLQQK